MENFKPFVSVWGGGPFGGPQYKKESSVPKDIFGCFDPRGSDIIKKKLEEFRRSKEEVKKPRLQIQIAKKVELKENVPQYVTPVSYCIVDLDMRYYNEEKIICEPKKFVSESHPFKVEFPLKGGSRQVKNFDPPQFQKKKKKKKFQKKTFSRGIQEKLDNLREQLNKFVSLLSMGEPKIEITRMNGKFGCYISMQNGKFEDEVSVENIFPNAREAEIACLEDVIQNCIEDYDELLRKQKDEEILIKNKKDMDTFEEDCSKEEDAVRRYFEKMEYGSIVFKYEVAEESYSIVVLVDGMSLFGWGINCKSAFEDLWIKIRSIFDPDIPIEERDLLKLCIEKGYPEPSLATFDLSVLDVPSFVSEIKVGNLRVITDSYQSKSKSRQVAVQKMLQKVRKTRYYEDVVDLRKEVYYKDDKILDKTVDEEGFSYSDEDENGEVNFEDYEDYET